MTRFYCGVLQPRHPDGVAVFPGKVGFLNDFACLYRVNSAYVITDNFMKECFRVGKAAVIDHLLKALPLRIGEC